MLRSPDPPSKLDNVPKMKVSGLRVEGVYRFRDEGVADVSIMAPGFQHVLRYIPSISAVELQVMFLSNWAAVQMRRCDLRFGIPGVGWMRLKQVRFVQHF